MHNCLVGLVLLWGELGLCCVTAGFACVEARKGKFWMDHRMEVLEPASNHVWRSGRLGVFLFSSFCVKDKIVSRNTTCWKAEKTPVYSVLLLCTGGKAPRASFATGSGGRIRAPFVLALVRVSGIVLYTCTSIPSGTLRRHQPNQKFGDASGGRMHKV